jgi:hypothetical protein
MTEAAQAPFKGPFQDEITAAKIAHEFIDQNAVGLSGPASIDQKEVPMCILWRAGKPVAVAAIIRDDMNYSYAVLARAPAPAGHVLTGEECAFLATLRSPVRDVNFSEWAAINRLYAIISRLTSTEPTP